MMTITDLNNRSYQSLITPNSELFFEFVGFEVLLSVRFSNEFELNPDDYFRPISEYLTVFENYNLEILSINITSHEFLGNRKGIPKYSEPMSISFEMFSFLRVLNKIDNNIVLDYGLYIDDQDPMCSVEPNYFFKIKLKTEGILLIEIVNELEKTKFDNVPSEFYWNFYNKNTPFDDCSSLEILTTNTKVRRLGYLKLLNDFIKNENKIPQSKIDKKFENFSSTIYIENQLLKYKDNKGSIKITKTGISAQPYIKFAENLELLLKINNVYSEGKKMKVYRLIKDRLDEKKTENVFALSYFDKLFFLERILETDFLYTTVLFELLYIKRSTSFDELKNVFQIRVLNRINYYLTELVLKDSVKRQIKIVRKRILSWKKPNVYLEHIIMPRINWLLDLDLVSYNDDTNEYYINDIGEEFMSHLCSWYDIESAFILNPKEYLDRFIQHSFVYSNDTTFKIKESNIKSLNSVIEMFIDESFELFKTLAPNRTTLSQAVNYTKYMTYINYGIPVEFKYIVNHIKDKKDKYIYKYQNQYKDGYIQKR